MEQEPQIIQTDQGRRKFIFNLTKVAGAGIFLSAPLISAAGSFSITNKTWTVGEIINLFIKEVQGAPFANTVDTLKSGSLDNQVSGIVTTMFATIGVIKKTIDAGSNFIIAHEPTFYNHLDETNWLSNDEVYRYKTALLNDNNITIWRNHDYIHRHMPDGVLAGVLDQLGWQQYVRPALRDLIEIPAITVDALISHMKQKLGIAKVRFIGDPGQTCRKILLMPGAAGGRHQIQSISQFKPDVAVVGEVQEWETAEYVRDARSSGKKISLIVLGHSDSEEPGSEFMANWIKLNVPGIKLTHIPSGNPFRFS